MLGSVKFNPNNVMDQRPSEPLGSWTEMKHHDAGPTAQGVQGSSTALQHAVHHAIHVHARKCRISYLNFLEFVFGIFRILSREGGDLHDQILSVISWKNKRKCQKMVLFSWFSWKMVKYFISILSYFQLFSHDFELKSAIFSQFSSILSYFQVNIV